MRAGDRGRVVGRAIVDDDRPRSSGSRGRAAPSTSRRSSSPRCSCTRRPRSRASRHARATALPRTRRRRRRGRASGCARAVGEPEVPVVDVVAATMPLVGPGEDERARAARRERRAELPVESVAACVSAVAAAVETELRDHERPVAGDVLQPREVGLQALGVLEVDVEATKSRNGSSQVLRRREVDVRDERVGVGVLRRRVQALEEALDTRGVRASARSAPGSRCRSRSRARPDGPHSSRTPARTRSTIDARAARGRRGTRRAAPTAARPAHGARARAPGRAASAAARCTSGRR